MNEILDKGITFHKSGKLKKAQKIYENFLNKHPYNFRALSLLGSLNLQQNKYSEAEKYIVKAININPQYFGSYNNLGTIYLNQKKYEDAINSFKKALELNPLFVEGFNNLAITQKKNYLFDEALINYQTAIKLKPTYFEAHCNLGILYKDNNKLKEAIDKFNETINLNPKYIDAFFNRALTHFYNGSFNLAIEDYNKLKLLDKNNYLFYYFESFLIEAHICNWKNYRKFLQELKIQILNKKYICDPIKLLYHYDCPGLIKYNINNLNKKNFCNTKQFLIKKSKRKNKKIKIAYYSADLREHAVGNLLINILENHNKKNFEIISFYLGEYKNDEITEKIIKASDNFIYAVGMSNEKIISTSLNLEIDIAIDLSGFTRNNRAEIFKTRIAPIQINFMGYPGTTGKYIDYIIADKNLITKFDQKFYFEKIIYLKNFFLPPIDLYKNDLEEHPAKIVNSPKNKFIYCCFNMNYKINPEIFYCWMEILKNAPNSALFLLETNKVMRDNLIIEAEKKGVSSDRVVFFPMVSYAKRFEKFKFCDVFLDTFPYGAHSTSIETLSCFVPIITIEGNSFQSRVCSSLLKNLNLSELVKVNLEEYKELAISLYKDPNKLKNIKKKLSYELNNNPTFNKKAYVKNLENAYQKVYDNF
jgi:protein O-GlcNAc transferase